MLGGVPYCKIRYENLTAVVAKVLGIARERVPALSAPTIRAGVERQIGVLRRNHFVPALEIDSRTQLNELIGQWNI
ncbi:hypothetical protein ACQPXM_11405 [Kribbella sp. CA-253562]|uniref:hypothetical protein n=1 Tax=Kribbella sp. CA-253562 TaxID=3239942 RepID=UPI003D90EB9D